MPAPTFTITYNTTTNQYDCHPKNQDISKSVGVIFTTSRDCRVCFDSTSVFGISTLDLTTGNPQQPPVTGNVGASTKFGVIAAGGNCNAARLADVDDPFTVTIGSQPKPHKPKPTLKKKK